MKCAACDQFFTVDNPGAANMPIRAEYPGGVQFLYLPDTNDGDPICRKCVNKFFEEIHGVADQLGLPMQSELRPGADPRTGKRPRPDV